MAISITIKKIKENKDNRTVFFVLEKESKKFKFHADIPKEGDALQYLTDRKEDMDRLIQDKISRGVFVDKHPDWIENEYEIDSLPSKYDDLKPILKKIARK